MRYAVLTDVHGDIAALGEVLARIRRQDVDQVICLGDVFECRVSKSRAAAHVFRTVEDVFEADPRTAELLDGVLLLRGNQEERIASLVPPAHLPPWTPPLLRAPLEHRTGFAVYCHGHPLPWRETEPGVWSPVDADFPGRVLVHGHHHRSALHQVPLPGTGHAAARRLPVRFDEPVHLASGARYVVNVGSVATAAPERGPSPAWVVVDEDAATVTYHHCDPSGSRRHEESA
ncbi:metallophosphoesterase family protein [Streptomyces griseochromogenes]|uniref:metallophosphoesterase family protein n=1 Tax=Streptomyces griseochromogenes TaxID=68214 RepID=UPI0037ACC106